MRVCDAFNKLLEDRFQKLLGEVTRHLDPETADDETVYTGLGGVAFVALKAALALQGDERRNYLRVAEAYLRAAKVGEHTGSLTKKVPLTFS
jgi:hypothetical protein